MANEKFFLGLDIGSNSVGWAVTDENYKIKKFKGNLMWGVHLFDEAQQSADRRMFRTARRRLDRRQQRIVLLQELFAAEILKKDEKFFLRLKESALLPEDSDNRKHNIFFDDDGYGDKEYYAQYPTIHHLIAELMSSDSSHDIRLVYYACAYILAHRGHFLFNVEKDNIDKITDFKPLFKKFYSDLTELCETPAFDANAEIMEEVLKKHISVTAKDRELKQLLFGGKVPKDIGVIKYELLTKLICGGTVKLSELFRKEEYAELEKNSICVKNSDFSDTLENLEGQIDELHFALIASVKAMYDWSLLVDILHGETMISKSKVEVYDKHKADLKELKYFIKTYLNKAAYDAVFREISDKANYVSYVYNASSDDERNKYKRCSQEDFCKFLKPYLAKITPTNDDKERFDELKKKCEDNELCPKQVTTDNRVIPYQLYYAELKKILENACKYLPFLNEKDEYGTVADKILKIMEFRIPYYAGPLISEEKSANAWLKRKAEGKIYPWNFRDIVEEDASENEFIRRMTCKCTYLAGEDVLPKYSLLYSKFMVLNEINNIKVNGEPISVEAKQKLYQKKFVESKARVTKKRIKEFLVSIGEYSGEVEVTGVDDTIKSSLRSYHDFKPWIESGLLKEFDVEKIIERITVTTDTKRLKNWLKQEYPQLSASDVKYISKLKYKDYGRLSRCFLEEIIPIDADTGEVLGDNNIITALWETNSNLMQLLSMGKGYSKYIEKFNNNYFDQHPDEKSISRRLKNMYVPTAVRRSITRTLDIVKELKTILKKAPDKIFIEMARGEGDTPKGSRTKSRRDQITEYLDNSDAENIGELRERLEKTDDGRLRSEKIFLYFMQLGKCAYTGKNISFDELDDNTKWNIDHIWPHAKIKDDSIDNKVLVDSNANGAKGDKYPISSDIRSKMTGFWHALYKKNMMSEKKYQRLMRSTPFTEEELSGFIARQLVETRQSTKAVATILKEIFPESEIVYVKAGIVSEFRQEMDMLKCREINDLHHAKDAYLNIVMGNVYNTKFTKDPLNFIKSGERYSMKLFKKDQSGKESGLLTGIVKRGDNVAWDPETSFDIVRHMMSKNSIRYVRYTYKRKGGLFNQMPERKKPGLVPRKKGLDTEKYGGYNNTTAACFSLIKYKNDVIIIPVENMYLKLYETNKEFRINYSAIQMKEILSSDINIKDISFPFENRIIKINTLIEVDGFRCNIVQKSNKGRTIVVSSAESLIVGKEMNDYIKKVSSYLEKSEKGKKFAPAAYSRLNTDDNVKLFDLLCDKISKKPFSSVLQKIGNKIQNKREDFLKLELKEQILFLSNMILLLKTGRSTGCDLKLIGESGQAGVITLNSTLTKIGGRQSIRIIDQSPTGLLEKKSVNLLEL
ncbi:type II CRISPR RNA-guided endonuclease Cas9 [Ruminococcus flavefaciens]|uniref:CRISPR-associated endonuclease Cas9 n=1 Tax=Ruminococcus flavefaciens TaxID=1265 RepID=A0A315XZB8_RUMFL|nr:type II CRISPR RNA-guided endonuclease Cas9 [Ruminococcus flavefaciens]PWJ11200.1 CRISPR-associated endonuclease Csn1 [Ruminococcus flavefaciens]SSA50762.1 CRISPR-associated endonuclease Csn1 [Ruminococcus flavefaciens]